MSNETMTDAGAERLVHVLMAVARVRPLHPHELDELHEAHVYLFDRLRGEAAPEGQAVAPDTVLIGPAVCYGGDGDGDWFKELTVEGVTFLAPLDDYERARHILAAKKRRPQPAAPAPVAGDAVANLPEKFRNKADSLQFSGTWPGDYVADFVRDCADALEAALAQDRASQAGAAGGVPEGWNIEQHEDGSVTVEAEGYGSTCLQTGVDDADGVEAALLRLLAIDLVAPTPAADHVVEANKMIGVDGEREKGHG